jgi:hypothetical protein
MPRTLVTKEEKTSLERFNKLPEEVIEHIFQNLGIEDWIRIKSTSSEWYQYVINMLNTISLSKHLTQFWDVPFRFVPVQSAEGGTFYSLNFLPEDKGASAVIPSIRLPENIDVHNKADVQTFVNNHLIRVLGWNNTANNASDTLLDILVYLKAKKVFTNTDDLIQRIIRSVLIYLKLKEPENFIKQAIEFFNNRDRLLSACCYDRSRIFAWLVMNSPLKKRLFPSDRQVVAFDADQSRIRRALVTTLAWYSRDVRDQYSEIELKFFFGGFVAVNLWSWWKSSRNNDIESLAFLRTMLTFWSGFVALQPLMQLSHFTRNFFSNLYYDSDRNIGSAAARYPTKQPYILPGNFLKGNALSFFKKNTGQLKLIPPAYDSENKKTPTKILSLTRGD